MSNAPLLVLASGSPRRREFLTQLGLSFEVHPADIDETPLPAEDPVAYVQRVASTKAVEVAGARWPAHVVVLAADTTVALDGEILAKPVDAADAVAMLTRLSGREHDVHTAVAVLGAAQVTHSPGSGSAPGWFGFAPVVRTVSTVVRFETLTDAQIRWYVNTGEPLDKAGAYGLQGAGGVFVRSVTGSVSNVVGLPLAETAELLRTVGVDVCD